MSEVFRPMLARQASSFLGRLANSLRLLVDLQNCSIYRDLKQFAGRASGKVLDVGCGNAPYRGLFEAPRCTYQGIDINEAGEQFDVSDASIIYYDGKHIPFPDGDFDGLISLEVLEHVEHYQELVDEMARVLKPGGLGLVTVPWTMRYHFIPYDYFRYTPTTLRKMFAAFREVTILPRGTDVTVCAYKLIILWLRHFFPARAWQWLLLPLGLLLTPLALVALFIAHVSLRLRLGNPDDPLGYTVLLTR